MNSDQKSNPSLPDRMLEANTPQIYEKFKTAVAIRKWPDGRILTQEQLNTCMQAIILYENQCVPPEQRTAYVPRKSSPCKTPEDEQILKWNDE